MSVTRRSGRAMLAVLPIGVGLLAWSPPALADGTTGRVAWVIDGDTFRLASGERIRIAGIDAPETRADQAKCRAEVERGRAATREATALLRGRMVSIERVGRSYGRTVARITLDGRDLSGELVARGIALPGPAAAPSPTGADRRGGHEAVAIEDQDRRDHDGGRRRWRRSGTGICIW